MGHILIYKITRIGHAFWLVKNPWFFVPVPYFLRVTGVITHLGCWENTRKAYKSPAFGSRFTSFSRVLPTSRVAYDAGRPIESVVYYLNNQHDKILWIYNCNTPHIYYIHHFHIDHDAPRLRETSVFKNFPVWEALNMGFSLSIFNGRVDKRLIRIRAPWVPETFSCAVSGFGPKIYQPAPDTEPSRRRRDSHLYAA